jgi:hypothetical protein
MVMNIELERVRFVAIVALSQMLWRELSGGIEENHGKPSQNSLCSGRDPKWDISQTQVEALPLEPA